MRQRKVEVTNERKRSLKKKKSGKRGERSEVLTETK